MKSTNTATHAEIEARIRAGGGRLLSVPIKHRSHGLVAGKFFYTLPESLWSRILDEIPKKQFSAELLSLDNELGRLGEDHSARVGFRDGMPIYFDLLGVPKANPLANKQVPRQTEIVAEKFRRNVRGYLGWLVTNPDFTKEHDRLFAECRTVLAATSGPFHAVAAVSGNAIAIESGMIRQQTATAEEATIGQFCLRWRLQGIAGPCLLNPLVPEFPACLPLRSAEWAKLSGVRFIAIPDTMPVPSEDDLRWLADGSVTHEPPKHLAVWAEIIRGGAAKNELKRYARIFPLLHYWCVLMSRHADALHRQQGRLEEAFAGYFGVERDSIRGDLRLIARRLGPDWQARLAALR